MGKGNDPNCATAAAPMSALLDEASGDAGAPAARVPSDPTLAGVVAVLRGEQGDLKDRERLARLGLMVALPRSSGAYGASHVSRYVPSTLGQIAADKGRLPTDTEFKRTVKNLDAQLKKAGVHGDVTGGYYYESPSRESQQIALQRLISDRKSIRPYRQAVAAGTFENVTMRNAASRAARDQLVELVEKRAQDSPYLAEDLTVVAGKLRSGVISKSQAAEALQRSGPGFNASADSLVARDAISLGLGLPTERETLTSQRAASDASMRRLLDRVHAGSRATVDDGEISWSAAHVADPRVLRAAFGYNAAANQIQVDYEQAGIIELRDGTVDSVTVKRAHSPLEHCVEEVVENGRHHTEQLASAAEREQQAQKLLRRWARSS